MFIIPLKFKLNHFLYSNNRRMYFLWFLAIATCYKSDILKPKRKMKVWRINMVFRHIMFSLLHFVVISISTKEDTTVGSSITTVSAIDRDKQAVTYIFRSRYSNFLLDSLSGEIFLSKPLDREVAPIHELQIVASDGSRSATATVIVTVGDVNEPPQFTEINYL